MMRRATCFLIALSSVTPSADFFDRIDFYLKKELQLIPFSCIVCLHADYLHLLQPWTKRRTVASLAEKLYKIWQTNPVQQSNDKWQHDLLLIVEALLEHEGKCKLHIDWMDFQSLSDSSSFTLPSLYKHIQSIKMKNVVYSSFGDWIQFQVTNLYPWQLIDLNHEMLTSVTWQALYSYRLHLDGFFALSPSLLVRPLAHQLFHTVTHFSAGLRHAFLMGEAASASILPQFKQYIQDQQQCDILFRQWMEGHAPDQWVGAWDHPMTSKVTFVGKINATFLQDWMKERLTLVKNNSGYIMVEGLNKIRLSWQINRSLVLEWQLTPWIQDSEKAKSELDLALEWLIKEMNLLGFEKINLFPIENNFTLEWKLSLEHWQLLSWDWIKTFLIQRKLKLGFHLTHDSEQQSNLTRYPLCIVLSRTGECIYRGLNIVEHETPMKETLIGFMESDIAALNLALARRSLTDLQLYASQTDLNLLIPVCARFTLDYPLYSDWDPVLLQWCRDALQAESDQVQNLNGILARKRNGSLMLLCHWSKQGLLFMECPDMSVSMEYLPVQEQANFVIDWTHTWLLSFPKMQSLYLACEGDLVVPLSLSIREWIQNIIKGFYLAQWRHWHVSLQANDWSLSNTLKPSHDPTEYLSLCQEHFVCSIDFTLFFCFHHLQRTISFPDSHIVGEFQVLLVDQCPIWLQLTLKENDQSTILTNHSLPVHETLLSFDSAQSKYFLVLNAWTLPNLPLSKSLTNSFATFLSTWLRHALLSSMSYSNITWSLHHLQWIEKLLYHEQVKVLPVTLLRPQSAMSVFLNALEVGTRVLKFKRLEKYFVLKELGQEETIGLCKTVPVQVSVESFPKLVAESGTGVVPVMNTVPEWIMLVVDQTKLHLLFQSSVNALIPLVIRGIQSILHGVNQTTLLNELAESHRCGSYLEAPDDRIMETQTNHSSSSDDSSNQSHSQTSLSFMKRRKKLIPGCYSCPCLYQFQFQLHPRYSSNMALQQVCDQLHPFMVTNRRSLMVYRTSGPLSVIYYMKWRVSNSVLCLDLHGLERPLSDQVLLFLEMVQSKLYFLSVYALAVTFMRLKWVFSATDLPFVLGRKVSTVNATGYSPTVQCLVHLSTSTLDARMKLFIREHVQQLSIVLLPPQDELLVGAVDEVWAFLQGLESATASNASSVQQRTSVAGNVSSNSTASGLSAVGKGVIYILIQWRKDPNTQYDVTFGTESGSCFSLACYIQGSALRLPILLDRLYQVIQYACVDMQLEHSNSFADGSLISSSVSSKIWTIYWMPWMLKEWMDALVLLWPSGTLLLNRFTVPLIEHQRHFDSADRHGFFEIITDEKQISLFGYNCLKQYWQSVVDQLDKQIQWTLKRQTTMEKFVLMKMNRGYLIKSEQKSIEPLPQGICFMKESTEEDPLVKYASLPPTKNPSQEQRQQSLLLQWHKNGPLSESEFHSLFKSLRLMHHVRTWLFCKDSISQLLDDYVAYLKSVQAMQPLPHNESNVMQRYLMKSVSTGHLLIQVEVLLDKETPLLCVYLYAIRKSSNNASFLSSTVHAWLYRQVRVLCEEVARCKEIIHVHSFVYDWTVQYLVKQIHDSHCIEATAVDSLLEKWPLPGKFSRHAVQRHVLDENMAQSLKWIEKYSDLLPGTVMKPVSYFLITKPDLNLDSSYFQSILLLNWRDANVTLFVTLQRKSFPILSHRLTHSASQVRLANDSNAAHLSLPLNAASFVTLSALMSGQSSHGSSGVALSPHQHVLHLPPALMSARALSWSHLFDAVHQHLLTLINEAMQLEEASCVWSKAVEASDFLSFSAWIEKVDCQILTLLKDSSPSVYRHETKDVALIRTSHEHEWYLLARLEKDQTVAQTFLKETLEKIAVSLWRRALEDF